MKKNAINNKIIKTLLTLCGALYFSFPITQALGQIEPEGSSSYKSKEQVIAKDFMVVAANPIASEVGKNILVEGGNALDAAIAMQFVLNVVEPQSSGIGGGGFLLFHDAKLKKLTTYDGRETAPNEAREDMFLAHNKKPMEFFDAIKGGLSVGTPGLLHMLKKAHDVHGKMEFAKLFVPAIKIAQEGFAISERLHSLINQTEHIKKFASSYSYFFTKEGKAKPTGTILKNPQLAQSFAKVADKGIEIFYEGEIAEEIITTVQNSEINPGLLSISDLKNYQAVEKQPLCQFYQSYKICAMGLPSSGGVTIFQALKILTYNKFRQLPAMSVDAYHVLGQATYIAFADRNAYLADDAFVTVPLQRMLNDEYLAQRANLIDQQKAIFDIMPGLDNIDLNNTVSFEKPSTTHICVVDKEKNAVSMTTSIEHAFGSGLMTSGFLLNNQLTDFSFISEQDGKKIANRVEPGKKPRSSMSPIIVYNEKGELFMLVGSPGGSRIIPYVLNTIIAIIDWNLTPEQAVALPNVLNINGTFEIEEHRDTQILVKGFEKKGNKIILRSLNSGINVLMLKDAKLIGAADPRREGIALGQ